MWSDEPSGPGGALQSQVSPRSVVATSSYPELKIENHPDALAQADQTCPKGVLNSVVSVVT